MKKNVLLLAFAAFVLTNTCFSQQTYPLAAPSDKRPGLYAFTNATVFTDYKTKAEGATLLIRDGKVVAAGTGVTVPADAVTYDCSGKTIYPSFIDLYATDYGLPAPPPAAQGGRFGQQQQAQPSTPAEPKGAAYSWNEALKPEFNAVALFTNDAKASEDWRKQGFGAVLTHRSDGISRGTGALVLLGSEREHEMIVSDRVAHFLSLKKGSSRNPYPSSLMGLIALIRQTYMDGQWYKTEGYKTEKNLSLDAWNAVQSLPQVFEAGEKLDIFRINRIGEEFGVKYIVKTSGDEYQRLNEVAKTGYPLIVPVNFPEGYDVRDPYDALNVSLTELKHWEMAPANAGMVQTAGITFALTSNGLKERSKFLENVRKTIEYGLTEENALKALTFTPATLAGAYNSLGSLEPGKTANFIVTNGNIFKAETKILQNWCNGAAYDVTVEKAMPREKMGTYDLKAGDKSYTLTLKGKPDAPEAQLITADSLKLKATFSFSPGGLVTLSFQPDTLKKGNITLSGAPVSNGWSGNGTMPDGSWLSWSATQTKGPGGEREKQPAKQNPVTPPEIGAVTYPFTAFGWKEKPKAQTFLIRNATVWTGEKDGILKNADVLVNNGKIQRIGRNLPVQDNASVIDGTGKHLTAGIIDEHSHIAITRNLNEGTQESTSEVRIGDVVDSEDIDIYRQLAGGVTSSHLLHGSANPIGGQTQLIKLRWGLTPEEMKFQNWPGFIKFALGENVKQSSSPNSTRFPQTRMGVEETFSDYFTRAQEYGKLKRSGKPYRKDLELEALLEIIESKRFITCHSYVQSEITMMIRVAEKFGFRLNTFTHILEGYKVADKMAKHGAGGSSFSDWWAYKYEVYEAIPQNAKIMADQGVVVAINSDDAEMARRLNQEAAKSVMYAGMSQEDAWKMVTINPARLLHVDDRTGSIKAGKDADLVLWNDNPLSIYASADKTWVDGAVYFDREQDVRLQDELQRERARIIQKMQAEKKGGEGGERPRGPKEHYHCDTEGDEGN